MADFGKSLSSSSLLCRENDEVASRLQENSCSFQGFINNEFCFVLESEDIEYIEKMVETETTNPTDHSDDCLNTNHSWLKFARFDAIDWIFNARSILGFRFQTAYLSVTYFDRFLSKRSIDNGNLWAIRLLSVACLSLAAKMEEYRVPYLSEFPIEDYYFESKVIQRMELMVLNILQWKMSSITPFSYLHYFFNKICGESGPNQTVSRAAELVLAVIKEINLLDHRPSVIAMAAVLAAAYNQLTRQEFELKLKVVPSRGSPEIERVFSCYILMQEIEMAKLKTSKQVISPNSSSIHSNAIPPLAGSSFPAFGAATKRRPTYSDSDQNSPLKRTSHLP